MDCRRCHRTPIRITRGCAASWRSAAPGASDGALALDGHFGLNPGLSFLHEAYGAHEALVLHAVATPYRERSHFDGQDVLESGVTQPHASQSGWLNRALVALPAAARAARESGVALGQNVPLVLRGPAPIASWSPSMLPGSTTTPCSASPIATPAIRCCRSGWPRRWPPAARSTGAAADDGPGDAPAPPSAAGTAR